MVDSGFFQKLQHFRKPKMGVTNKLGLPRFHIWEYNAETMDGRFFVFFRHAVMLTCSTGMTHPLWLPVTSDYSTSSRFGDDGGLWALTRDANRSPWAGNTETHWSFSVPIQFWVYSIGRGHKILAFALKKCSVVWFKKPSPENCSGTGQVAPTMSETSSQLEVPGQFLFGTNGQGPSEWKNRRFARCLWSKKIGGLTSATYLWLSVSLSI